MFKGVSGRALRPLFWSRLMDVGLDIWDSVHRITAGLLPSVWRGGLMGQWEENVSLRW